MKTIKSKFVVIIILYEIAIGALFVYYLQQDGATPFTVIKDLSPTAIISGLITLYMTYVYQNNTVAMQEQTKITSSCPRVILRNELELPEINNKVLMKLRISDENHTMLTKAIINEIKVSWSDDLFGNYEDPISVYIKQKDQKYTQLEYTPSDSSLFYRNEKEREDYYYLIQEPNCTQQELFKKCFKMSIDLSVCSNDVEVNYRYTILVNPDDTDCLEYDNYIKSISHKYFVIKSTKYIGNNK